MNETYIAPHEARRKLELARNMHHAVYIYGATGFGKTRLVQEFTAPLHALWTGADLDAVPEAAGSPDAPLCVVIDDLQKLRDTRQIEKLKALILRNDLWVIMIGRMPTPSWMVPLIAAGRLSVIPEDALALSAGEIKKIAAAQQLFLDDEICAFIAQTSLGNGYAIMTTLQMLMTETGTIDMLREKIEQLFSRHLEENIIPSWSNELQEFLMQLSVVDSFTLPMAVMITGDDRAAAMLAAAEEAGNFLTRKDDTYYLRPILIKALRSRALKQMGLSAYNEYLNHAALYYETRGDVVSALKLYEQSGKKDSIRALLMRNGRRHMGVGHFYELRRYYLGLEESEAETAPVLMTVLCMLYSVMMNEEKSEYWYGKLRAYAASARGADRAEANNMLLYLDIGLPHRSSTDLLDILKRAIPLILSGELKLPEFSVTSNMPSTMNGGKDFCSWSKKDRLIAETVGRPLEKLMGDFGCGLVHAALAESFYEKGDRDPEVVHQAMLAQMDIESGGKTELLFAVICIQIRLSLLSGRNQTALQLLNSFEERAVREDKDALIPNIHALRCRIALMTGNKAAVDEWMKEAPDELSDFWSMERYRYITKVLCYLDRGQNGEAIGLLERLLYYAEKTKRPYIRMESNLLMAVARKREKLEWKELLLSVLKDACDFSFVRVISEKGMGVLPLLKAIKRDYLASQGADPEWFKRVLNETALIAEHYPAYLNSEFVQPSDFCETAVDVLRMQAKGMSVKEIAAALAISERTVKYHAAENYRKLGAKGKTDAVQIAKGMGLI